MNDLHIIIGADGAVRQVAGLAGEDVEGKAVYPIDRYGDLMLESFDVATGGWVDNMDALRSALIASIDQAREDRQQAELTAGTMKALVYAQKAREVDRYRNEPGVTRSPEQTQRDFPAAWAEMSVTGDTLAVVIDRIASASAQSNSEVFRLDALATCAKGKIRSAVDGPAARAAAAVDWQ